MDNKCLTHSPLAESRDDCCCGRREGHIEPGTEDKISAQTEISSVSFRIDRKENFQKFDF
jgi:hypothetical protein